MIVDVVAAELASGVGVPMVDFRPTEFSYLLNS